MASDQTYLERLEYIRDIYPDVVEGLPTDRPVEDWSPSAKGKITKAYHSARLLTAPSTLADRRDKGTLDYRYMIQTVRPFADQFDAADGYDLRKLDRLTSAQKSRLTRTYRALSESAAQPFYAYRTRDEKKLRKVQRAIGQGTHKGVGVALIPVPTTREKPTVRVRGDVVRIKSGPITKSLLRFEDFGFTMFDFARDPGGVTRAIVDATQFGRYSVMAGDMYEVTQGGRGIQMLSGDRTVEEVQKLVAKYNANDHDPNKKSSHYFGNWLFGLRGYEFDGIRQLQEYRQDDRIARAARREKRQKVAKQLARKSRRQQRRKANE